MGKKDFGNAMRAAAEAASKIRKLVDFTNALSLPKTLYLPHLRVLLPAFYEYLHACRREAMGSNQLKSGKINSNSNRNHTWDQTIASVLASVEDTRSMDVPVGKEFVCSSTPCLLCGQQIQKTNETAACCS